MQSLAIIICHNLCVFTFVRTDDVSIYLIECGSASIIIILWNQHWYLINCAFYERLKLKNVHCRNDPNRSGSISGGDWEMFLIFVVVLFLSYQNMKNGVSFVRELHFSYIWLLSIVIWCLRLSKYPNHRPIVYSVMRLLIPHAQWTTRVHSEKSLHCVDGYLLLYFFHVSSVGGVYMFAHRHIKRPVSHRSHRSLTAVILVAVATSIPRIGIHTLLCANKYCYYYHFA